MVDVPATRKAVGPEMDPKRLEAVGFHFVIRFPKVLLSRG